VKDIRAFEDGFYKYFETTASQVLADIEAKGALAKNLKDETALIDAITTYKQDFLAGLKDKQAATA
jgi:F-type H+-transporting ATPase subunit alpha